MPDAKKNIPILQSVSKTLREHCGIRPGDRLIVAVSAGSDSTALLHLLQAVLLDLRLTAVYIDHGLRPNESSGEIAQLRRQTRLLGIPLLLRTAAVSALQQAEKCSLEEAGRILRYQLLEEIRVAQNATAIATGHTADDQVEHFFIRLVRGCGGRGLAGMLPRHGQIIRPLLAISKQELTSYLAEQEIPCCYDSSNADPVFVRNRVRHELLPLLRQRFNPAIAASVLQTMTILRDEDLLLQELCRIACAELLNQPLSQLSQLDSARLDREKLRQLPVALQRRVLEAISTQLGSTPGFRPIETLRQHLLLPQSGATFHWPDGLRVQLESASVVFHFPHGKKKWRGNAAVPPPPPSAILNAPGTYFFPEYARTLVLTLHDRDVLAALPPPALYGDADLLAFPLELRPGQPGERMQPLGAPGSKTVARILSDAKVPRGQRPEYPLLLSDGRIAGIVGVQIADWSKVSTSTRRILCVRWQEQYGEQSVSNQQ